MNEYSFKGEKTSLRTLLSLLTTCNHDTAEEIITEIEKVSPVRAEKARLFGFLLPTVIGWHHAEKEVKN